MATMETFISSVGTVLTALVGWMGEVLEFITSSPALFIPLIIFGIVSFGVGLVLRIVRG